LANENNILTSYGYKFNFKDGHLVFDFSKMIEQIAEDVLSGIDKSKICGRFHETVAEAIIRAMDIIVRDSERKVVLSGGSFHNRYLRKRISEELTKKGFEVFVPEKIPCNDGGLSFGQLAAAEAKRRKESCVLAYQQK
jgi:hydrogenase maturation protein HypF